jgi:hypothetical protein
MELLKQLKGHSVDGPVSFLVEALASEDIDPTHPLAEIQSWYHGLEPKVQDLVIWLIYETASYASMGALELIMGVHDAESEDSGLRIQVEHEQHGPIRLDQEAPESLLVSYEDLLAEEE